MTLTRYRFFTVSTNTLSLGIDYGASSYCFYDKYPKFRDRNYFTGCTHAILDIVAIELGSKWCFRETFNEFLSKSGQAFNISSLKTLCVFIFSVFRYFNLTVFKCNASIALIVLIFTLIVLVMQVVIQNIINFKGVGI